MIILSCPKCNARLEIQDKYAGQTGACIHCKAQILVPIPETKLTPPPPTQTQNPQATYDPAYSESRLNTEIPKAPPQALSKGHTRVVFRPSIFRSYPVVFLLGLVTLPFFGLGILIILSLALTCLTSELAVEEDLIRYRKGILNRKTSTVTLVHVRNVQVSQGIFQRIFGTGTVEIGSAGSGGFEITAEGMPNPHRIESMIRDLSA